MAYRNAVGTLRMKARFGYIQGEHIGTIDVSLGTKTEYWANKYEDAVRSLANEEYPRPDLLIALKEGKWTPEAIYHKVRKQSIRKIRKIGDKDHDLRDALDNWIDTAETQRGIPLMEHTKKSYRAMIKHLMQEQFTPKHASICDLPSTLERFRQHYYPLAKYRTVNKAKALCLSFTRETQEGGKTSDLYRIISAIKGAPTDIKNSGKGLTVWEVVEIIGKIEDPRYKNIAIFQAFTGALASEYQSGFTIQPDRIFINGQKREARKREVPRLMDFKKEVLEPGHLAYNKALQTASNEQITQKDFRSTYHQWLKDAGIDRERIKVYMGWKRNEVVDSYSKAHVVKEVENFRRDTERLAQYIEDHWEASKEDTVPLPPIRLKRAAELSIKLSNDSDDQGTVVEHSIVDGKTGKPARKPPHKKEQ